MHRFVCSAICASILFKRFWSGTSFSSGVEPNGLPGISIPVGFDSDGLPVGAMLYANFGILRRSLGKELGWFDEELTMYGSDNSLTFKTLLAGHGVTSIPGAKLIHHGHADQQRSAQCPVQPTVLAEG